MFLRKKKQKRDQEAGLVFQWRGVKQHHLGKFIALMVAASCFAFAAYAVRIEGLKQPLVSKRTGTLILLNEDDPNCHRLMLQVEEKSPFPYRWDPAFDQNTRERISNLAEEVMADRWKYEPELRSMPPLAEKPTSLASILDPNAGLVIGLISRWSQDLEESEDLPVGDLYVRGNVIAKGALAKRLGQKEWALPANLVTEDWYGQSFRFMIGVDSRGIVRSCMPLPGGSMGAVRVTDRQKQLAVWLRAKQFKPAAKQGTDFGELQIRIEATRE